VGEAMSLRDAHVTDLPRLQEIERKAGEVFRHVGMNAVADDEPLSVDLLRGYVDRGRGQGDAAKCSVTELSRWPIGLRTWLERDGHKWR
jgi:hypothetical protein